MTGPPVARSRPGLLGELAARDRPLRVGLVGAGKFGQMYVNQARRVRGLHLAWIADLDLGRARATGAERASDDALAAIGAGDADVVIEATGSPAAGARHALAAIEAGAHVVMVTVEADALAGPLLARRAAAAGVVYSLAYGDQPALICELVDWARTAGFEVIAAGKGTKYLPEYHRSTPDTVWPYYGFTPEMVAAGDFNAQMFNSFLDGTKSAIEMTAVANATGLVPARDGLGFPACGVDDLPRVLRPRDEGGQLHHAGQV